MNFLSKLLQGIAFAPAFVTGVEGLFGQKNGAAKKTAALTLVQTAVSATDAVAGKEIVDAGQVRGRAGQIDRWVVQCLNASAWAKTKSA